jgi:hypothetical protein
MDDQDIKEIGKTVKEFTAVKDSGKRQEFETGSRRDTRDGKGRFDLIPTIPMRRIAKHYQNGSAKYGDRNWEKGQPLGRYLDSCERHLMAVKEGLEDEDHQAAVIWNMIAFMWTLEMVRAGALPAELNDMQGVWDQMKIYNDYVRGGK